MIRTPAALLLAALSVSAYPHDDDAIAGSQKLGKVKFPNSCSPKVQQKLQRGVAMLHSFWYTAAEQTFQEVAGEDPSCAIAAWGFASLLMSNPLAGIGASAKEAPRAQAAIDKGRQMGAKTQRERAYIEAVAAYYEDYGNRTERQRQLSRAKAYEALAAKYPKDDEAQIFYALYLAGTQLQSDQSYAAYLKAAGILEKQFAKYPNHPGVAHYLIHSYDAPPIAQKGVPAAKRYAGIAPDAPHALHMPSHIFTRVGAWQESAATNRRSADIAAKGREYDEGAHARDYMVYAYLQLAKDGEALKIIDEARQITKFNPARFTAPYALAAMPARYALERGAWREAARLEPQSTKFPFSEAIIYHARVLGAVRAGDLAQAKEDLKQIEDRREALRVAKNEYWGNEVEVMRLSATAWVTLAEGNGDGALLVMRQAADLEDHTEKHIVTPGRVVPARELLADMLMELKRPKEAFAEYEQSQKREPDRFRGLYGAALAAEMSGDGRSARKYYARLVQVAGKGDPRAELQLARSYLAQ